MAQLVNVIAPIMTDETGAWAQTIFYPYMHASLLGRGTVLNTLIDAPRYESQYGDVSYLDAAAVENGEEGTLTIFAVSKSLDGDMSLSCDLRQYEGYRILRHIVMSHEDLKAVNTHAQPDNVRPQENGGARLEKGHLCAVLPAKSWNVIVMGK